MGKGGEEGLEGGWGGFAARSGDTVEGCQRRVWRQLV